MTRAQFLMFKHMIIKVPLVASDKVDFSSNRGGWADTLACFMVKRAITEEEEDLYIYMDDWATAHFKYLR